jgi:peroxiredoxin
MTLSRWGLGAIFLPAVLSAQGVLPPQKDATSQSTAANPYLLIGDAVPETLTALDAEGKTRSLLSYKSVTEVLVIGFFSPRCEANEAAWRRLKHFYEAYKDWRVSFIGLSVQSDESLEELSQALKKAGLPYPVLRDEGQKAARALHVSVLPQIVIIDEWGQLRYRGSIDKSFSDKALESVIAHQEAVAVPEPTETNGCPIQ